MRKLAPLRGKVGQPSVPMALNPDGAFSIGIKIGRRSLDMLLVDFTGQVRERLSLDYAFPDPDTLFAEIGTRLRQLRKALKPALRERVHGIGIAAPLSLGGWQSCSASRRNSPRSGTASTCASAWRRWRHRACRSSWSRTPPPPAWPSWWPGAAAASAASCTCSSTPSSAAAWCSTATCAAASTATPARSARCRWASANRAARPPEQLLSVASLWNLEALYAKAGVDVNAWTDARALAEPWRRAHAPGWARPARPSRWPSTAPPACSIWRA